MSTRSDTQSRRCLVEHAAVLVGVDCGKHHHVMVWRRAGGLDSPPLTVEATPSGFAASLAKLQEAAGVAPTEAIVVGLELAGTFGLTFADFLADRGVTVVLVAPMHTRRWQAVQHGVPLKTDAHDALAVLALVAMGAFSPLPHRAPEFAHLRSLVHARERVVAAIGRTRNQVVASLDTAFPEALDVLGGLDRASTCATLMRWPTARLACSAPVEAVSATLHRASRNHLGSERAARFVTVAPQSLALASMQASAAIEVPQLLERLRLLRTHRAAIETTLADCLQRIPAARALLALPEVSTLTAAAILGEIGDPTSYQSVRQVVRLAGLTLIERSSGTRRGHPHRARGGRSIVRRFLYMLAVRSVRKQAADPSWRERYLALLDRNGGVATKALVALMRRWLRRCFAVARVASMVPV